MIRCLDFEGRFLAPNPAHGFSLADYWVWDASVIRDDAGLYHLFASRWPRAYSMHPGWVFKAEIIRATSSELYGPYHFEEVVFSERGAEYWDGKATFNPCVRRVGNRYLLFYTGTTYPLDGVRPEDARSEDHHYRMAQLNKRIGLAIAETPAGPWQRPDHPLLQTRPGHFDSALISNPAPWVHADGSVLLLYKTRTLTAGEWSAQKLGAARAAHYGREYVRVVEQPLTLGSASEIEDPHLWWQEDHYELLAKDMTGRITGEKNAALHAYSLDGIAWALCDPPKAYSRSIRWADGTTQRLGSLERPFLYLENGVARCLFAASGDGTVGFSDARRTWVTAIPLRSE